jgi:hypothetical protein
LQSSDAATIVTFYGPGAQSPSTNPATPAGISIGSKSGYNYLDGPSANNKDTFFAFSQGKGAYRLFTAGSDLNVNAFSAYGIYGTLKGALLYGAQSGSANYANISFNGNDSVYEAVGQFYLDGAGGGYLVALARNNDNSALSISAGKTAIDPAVPEPSAIALLALGAGGMAMRRRRKAA